MMDRQTRQSLDDHIMGVHQYHEDAVPHRCPQCKGERTLRMVFDMGGWFYHPTDEDRVWCNKCQCEMEIIEKAEAQLPIPKGGIDMKQAFKDFGKTWKRWLIPVCGGAMAVSSLWHTLTLESPRNEYAFALLLAVLVVIVLHELIRYRQRR